MQRWAFALWASLGATTALACSLPHPPGTPHRESKADVYWPGPGISGAWYDPARSGEGIILQSLPDGQALLLWFTYSPQGESGEQAWLIAQGGRTDGDRVIFDQVLRPQGGRFGAAFDPQQVSYPLWGRIELRFADCQSLQISWQGPPEFGSGERALSRLSVLNEIDCGGARQLTASGARAGAGLRSRSGAWYVPERAGEGWIIEEIGGGQNLVYWFTFDPEGRQAWTVGNGRREGDRLRVDEQLIGAGTRFGPQFDPAAVQLLPWGQLDFQLDSCDGARLSYQSTRSGYGSGAHSLQRLTRLAGAPCLDQLPSATSGLNWSELSRAPRATSELAVAAVDDSVYALGGFGGVRSFQRYDRGSDRWTQLPDTPAGRDHLAAFALEGGVFMVGGADNGGGDQSRAAFRFDITNQTWAPVEGFASTYGSHAAVLNGQAFVGNADGSLQQFDPQQARVRRIAPMDFQGRDHSQLVAFMDEIWLIAGRSPETTRVAIYDPVSERWREGPAIRYKRGGFAAAAVGARIVIAGGEVLSGAAYVEGRSEVYRAGAESWDEGPLMPLPVHGTAGAALGNRFLLFGGATVAGDVAGASGRVFELSLPAP